MAEPDFESIMKKYRSLMGGAAPSEKVGKPENAKGRPASTEGSASSLEEIDPQVDRESQSDSGASRASEEPLPSIDSDEFLPADHIIRAPLPADRIEVPQSQSYESLMLNELFSSVARDEWSPEATLEHAADQERIKVDPESLDFARRLYSHEMDLRSQYDPSLGVYPGQALYVSRKKRVEVHESKKEEKKHVESSDKKGHNPLSRQEEPNPKAHHREGESVAKKREDPDQKAQQREGESVSKRKEDPDQKSKLTQDHPSKS